MKQIKIKQEFLDYIKQGYKNYEIRKDGDLEGEVELRVVEKQPYIKDRLIVRLKKTNYSAYEIGGISYLPTGKVQNLGNGLYSGIFRIIKEPEGFADVIIFTNEILKLATPPSNLDYEFRSIGHRVLITEDKDIETRPLETIQMIKAFGGYQKQEGVFSLKKINCNVKDCKELAIIIVDKFGGIVNTNMFYTCEKHNEKIEKAFKEYNELMIHNEKEIEKSITEALKKQLDKVKKEMN
ncbi:hypothetical protein KPH14_012950 [Odynerus spinipes]|uniref:DUF3850 domain-containing protein n=1 Tax=Odynerus spinipes TaxID=1348599 RepID=A0AAD9R7P8_9HYME|nr:hypothetical protein KPH14_012950 [Odynerus spinipes]